jgi:hypothetical protein
MNVRFDAGISGSWGAGFGRMEHMAAPAATDSSRPLLTATGFSGGKLSMHLRKDATYKNPLTVTFHPRFREQTLLCALFAIASACLRVFAREYRNITVEIDFPAN